MQDILQSVVTHRNKGCCRYLEGQCKEHIRVDEITFLFISLLCSLLCSSLVLSVTALRASCPAELVVCFCLQWIECYVTHSNENLFRTIVRVIWFLQNRIVITRKIFTTCNKLQHSTYCHSMFLHFPKQCFIFKIGAIQS